MRDIQAFLGQGLYSVFKNRPYCTKFHSSNNQRKYTRSDNRTIFLSSILSLNYPLYVLNKAYIIRHVRFSLDCSMSREKDKTRFLPPPIAPRGKFGSVHGVNMTFLFIKCDLPYYFKEFLQE